jgi:hypothetical protein
MLTPEKSALTSLATQEVKLSSPSVFVDPLP